MATILWLFLLPVLFHEVKSGDPKTDLTVILSPIFVDLGSGDDAYIDGFLADSSKSSTYNIGRETDTGPGDVGNPIINPPDNYVIDNPGFPTGSTVNYESTATSTRMELKLHGAQESAERIGAFFVEAVTPGGQSERITAIKTASEATISFPAASKTTSISDYITLDVLTNVDENLLKWRHNGEELPLWSGQKSVTISNVRIGDRGIYECYEDGHHDDGLHAIMSLIVRYCPKSRYGSNCASRCESCYNNGVCDAETGNCICRPGFMGEHCEIGCGSSVFGATCSISCVGGGCMGRQICAPGPVGCSCIAGYTGKVCDTGCVDNTFGANCEMLCHCQNCDNQRGCSGPCDNGYGGDLCQEPPVCSESTFGALCQYNCHCADSAKCDRLSGVCDNLQCASGWGGSDCQQALPAMYNPPITVADNDEASITVSFSIWHEFVDYGTRPVYGYVLHYGKGDIQHSMQIFETTRTITNLTRGPDYIFAVSVIGTDNKEGLLSPFANTRIECTVPTLAPTITKLNMDIVSAYIEWTIPETDDWLGCETSIASFTVYYTNGSRTIDPNQRSATITGLLPCTKYTFQVTVDNTDHKGPLSESKTGTTTACGNSQGLAKKWQIVIGVVIPLIIVVIIGLISYICWQERKNKTDTSPSQGKNKTDTSPSQGKNKTDTSPSQGNPNTEDAITLTVERKSSVDCKEDMGATSNQNGLSSL